MKAMILAAGLGTRLKPWTDHHSKALALINGKSLLQRNIEYLQSFGIKDVIVNVHHFSEQVIDTIQMNKGWGSAVTISDETDTVLETGGGLKKASWYFTDAEDFVLMNVDILTDLNLNAMVQQHTIAHPLATLAVSNRPTSRFFLFTANHELCGWRNIDTGKEKLMQTGTNLEQKAFSGIHIINSRIFSLITQEGKFSIVDIYLSLCNDHAIQYFDHSGNRFIDVGKPEKVVLAEKMFL